MKTTNILSILGLLSSSVLAAPSQQVKRDVNIFIQEPLKEQAISAPNDIATGRYYISSLAQDFGGVLGRAMREDKSLLPKAIRAVEPDTWAQVRSMMYLMSFLY